MPFLDLPKRCIDCWLVKFCPSHINKVDKQTLVEKFKTCQDYNDFYAAKYDEDYSTCPLIELDINDLKKYVEAYLLLHKFDINI